MLAIGWELNQWGPIEYVHVASLCGVGFPGHGTWVPKGDTPVANVPGFVRT